MEAVLNFEQYLDSENYAKTELAANKPPLTEDYLIYYLAYGAGKYIAPETPEVTDVRYDHLNSQVLFYFESCFETYPELIKITVNLVSL